MCPQEIEEFCAPEVKELVCECKVLTVHCACGKCIIGKMIYTPETDIPAVYPQSYLHKCDFCGNTKRLETIYPYQRYVPQEVPREPVGYEKWY